MKCVPWWKEIFFSCTPIVERPAIITSNVTAVPDAVETGRNVSNHYDTLYT